jgi:ABC-type transport system involved in cytochrome c biogenesis permease component
VVNPLIRHAAFRAAHQLGRRILVLAALCSFVLALTDPAMTRNGARVSRAYASVVWLEFALISVFALVEGGASIADERRRGTWEAVCLTDLTGGELVRAKLLGTLLEVAHDVPRASGLEESPSIIVIGARQLS